jgi:hypothetical protein
MTNSFGEFILKGYAPTVIVAFGAASVRAKFTSEAFRSCLADGNTLFGSLRFGRIIVRHWSGASETIPMIHRFCWRYIRASRQIGIPAHVWRTLAGFRSPGEHPLSIIV